MCSRPKRICKDKCNQALGFVGEEDDPNLDIFDHNNGNDDDTVAENDSEDEIYSEDDTLEEYNLTLVDNTDDSSDDEVLLNDDNIAQLTSPSGRVWHNYNPLGMQGRQPARNVISFHQGVRPGINPLTERESLLLFLNDTMEITLRYSNLHGRRIISQWNRTHPNNIKTFRLIDMFELEAFVGLLVLLGTFRSRYRDVDELWSTKEGFPVCRATMTRERFLQIKCVLRFDDPLRRNREDVLAPVRDMFENFNANLRRQYVPSPYLTIDEQLLEFHGRIRFKQYINTKPGKFGIEILWLCCAETFYMLNGVVYIGKGTVTSNQNLTTRAVSMHLMQPFLNTGRHLAGDNWFTTLELVDELRNNNTSYIGTLRNNNRSVPPIAKSTAQRQRKDSKVYYDNQGTALVSFWDKGTKPVLLVDTLHRNVPVSAINEKPCTVTEYNRTKSGVDIANKRLRGLSCKRKCRRWPYAIFSNMIDIAGNNGSIIFSERHPEISRKQEAHYNFLKNSGYQLVDRHIRRRLQNRQFLRETTKIATRLLGYDLPEPHQEDGRMLQSKRCAFCPSKKDRKTFVCCPRCHKARCNDHRSNLCLDCSME